MFDFREHPILARPSVAVDEAQRLAHERYGLVGEVSELGSNQDRNFLIDTVDGRAVLKVANAVFGEAELAAQDAAAAAVTAAGLRAPACRPDASGERIGAAALPGGPYRLRLLDYVEGEPLAAAGRFTLERARELGALSGRVARALAEVEHPGASQLTQWNLRIAGEVVESLAPSIARPERRQRVLSAMSAALDALLPLRERLRSQIIHGDLTDDNVVLGADGALDGVIDFGDVAESWTVAELAVTVASVLHHNPGEPEAVLETVVGFHEVLPLDDDELHALWPLVLLRAAVLVASGEHQVGLEDDNDYADTRRAAEWRAFVAATELDAATMSALLRWRLGEWSAPFAVRTPVRMLLDASGATRLDLSPTSAALDRGRWRESDIESRLAGSAGDSATIWAQPRLSRAVPLTAGEVATVPLGMEVTRRDVSPLTAPVAGELRREGDAVVLTGRDFELWMRGIDAPPHDGRVNAGTSLGVLPPHPARLHLQVSRLRGQRPPEFARPSEAALWRRVCPDPSALVGLAPLGDGSVAHGSDSDGADALLARRNAAFATVQEHYYAHPPRIERGWREHLIDVDAQSYLDMVNNVATVGHGHPRLTDAVAGQWARLNSNSRFHYAGLVEFSERLAALAPDPLDTVFLVNSGSEAVDLALRLATTATGRPTVIAVREAYHGWTVGSDAVSSSIGDNPRALESRPSWVRLIDAPNSFRGTHRGPDSGPRYLADLDRDLAALDGEGVRIAAVIAEAVYGNAGGVLLPTGYLSGVYERIRARGGLCIADEVQVGYGRLGEWFWGFQQQGVLPDIVTVAKAMGNGHPLGAVITTRAIADAFAAEGSLFSSAGGSPVSCVVGMTVLDIMVEEGLVENARRVGGALRAGLERLAERHELVGAVHGRGLYLGVELVRSRQTLEPATAEADAVCEALLREGVIVQPTGDHKNVLKIKPPMVLARESADFFLAALDRVLDRIGSVGAAAQAKSASGADR